MKVTLTEQTPDPIDAIVNAASTCYDSNPKSRIGLVKNLYKNGHHSPFEFVHFTWKVEDISRACLAQITRHRMCSFNVRSQRYCSEENFGYVIPKSVQENPDALKVFNDTIKITNAGYKLLQKYGIKNEDARAVLPNACCTTMYISCNLRELITIANQRLCTRAQEEVRELVKAMCNTVDPDLQFMLVPKCQSAFSKCNQPCGKMNTVEEVSNVSEK